MAEMEGCVTNQRLQQFTNDHTADITRMLQELIAADLLAKNGYGRWASYRLSPHLNQSDKTLKAPADITNENSGSKNRTADITDQYPDMSTEIDPKLLAIGEPARTQKRIEPTEMQGLIPLLCENRFLTLRQIATILSRKPDAIQRWTLRPMAQDNQLILAYTETLNHPKQAYKTNPEWKGS